MVPKCITLCMGSSCFSRGNAENHARIAAFLVEHGLTTRILFKGCRCGGICSEGPNLWVDGKHYSISTQGDLEKLLQSFLTDEAQP